MLLSTTPRMYTMYETLMSLPLFKGATHDAIHLFAEKTHLSFEKFKKGDTIFHPGQQCDSVHCLLSGSIISKSEWFEGKLTISEVSGPNIVIGGNFLFGMSTSFSSLIEANEDCGLMSFSKKKYLELLQHNQIFLINFLNLLSLEAQYDKMAINRVISPQGIMSLPYIVDVTTRRNSNSIMINSANTSLANLFNIESSLLQPVLNKLEDCNIVKVISDRAFNILNRNAFLEFFYDQSQNCQNG